MTMTKETEMRPVTPVSADSHATRLSITSKSPIDAVTPSQLKTWNTKNLGLRMATDFAAAASAASMVAPVITIIDKGIMENASGKNNLRDSIRSSLKDLILRPQNLLFSKPFALICMLYGGTYLTANTVDTITSTVQNKSPTLVTAGTLKFAASSTANIGICLFKDQAFARLFGPGGPPRPVPGPSYVLFAARDCLTIFASFNLPPLLGPMIDKGMTDELSKSLNGATIAQFVAPASVQLLSTPMHLLGLDLYNRPSMKGNVVTWGDRWGIIKKNWGISAVARICRIVPAFGVGGVVNKKVRGTLMEKWS